MNIFSKIRVFYLEGLLRQVLQRCLFGSYAGTMNETKKEITNTNNNDYQKLGAGFLTSIDKKVLDGLLVFPEKSNVEEIAHSDLIENNMIRDDSVEAYELLNFLKKHLLIIGHLVKWN